MLAGAPAPAPDGYEEAHAAMKVIGPLYERRVGALRVGAAMAATALPTHTGRTPVWGERAGDRVLWPTDTRWKDQKPFPQAGIMMDRITRLLTLCVLSLQKNASCQHADVQEQLRSIELAARRWIERAAIIGLDAAPSEKMPSNLPAGSPNWSRPAQFPKQHTVPRHEQVCSHASPPSLDGASINARPTRQETAFKPGWEGSCRAFF